MTEKSYPFPIYSGILNRKHYDKIGSAIWLFLWCISSTTKEIEKEGITWGIVLGNKPLKASELAAVFGVNEKTIRRWLSQLEQSGYIAVTRAPYGLILSVRHSKKWLARNVRSQSAERTNESSDTGKPVRSNQDVIQMKTKQKQIQAVAERFAALRSLQEGRDVRPAQRDYEAIARIVARGVSLPQTIKWLEQCFLEYEERRKSKQETIKVFSYCEKYILDRLQESGAGTRSRRENNGQTHDRRCHERTEKKKPFITGGQTGRIRRQTV
ncbi:ArsR family transcriptional regulator [Bacillus sp. z60-18]|uniref:ArsR family transcriptional regulator n=1 Tax=Bacillus TaxID=1386 RepID=UPI00098BA244|nr:ArsR family transcriptional regulator [Bacillus sonorensis]